MRFRDRVFVVTLRLPEDATVEAMTAYIEDAIATHKGSYHPDEPIFDLDGDTVHVLSVPHPRSRK